MTEKEPSRACVHVSNIKNVSVLQAHLNRTESGRYIDRNLTYLNEIYLYSEKSLAELQKDVKVRVKEKTGRKLQLNASPLVMLRVLVPTEVTVETLRLFCDRIHDKFGLIPEQIHIHRDESQKHSKVYIPNIHAHLIFRKYGENGMRINIPRCVCMEFQDMAAECLGMERGRPWFEKERYNSPE